MNADRARDILNSYGVVKVTYDGQPVWLEQIADADAGLVQFHYLDSRKLGEAPAKMLLED